MRRPEDLRRAFADHDPRVGDVSGLVAGIHSGIARRAVRRRRAGIAAAGVSVALLIGVPAALVGASADRAPVATTAASGTPDVTARTTPAADPFDPARLSFVLDPAPGGFPITEELTARGTEQRSYFTAGSDPDVLQVRSYDPARAGLAAPVLTGTTIAVGDLEVAVVQADPTGLGSYTVGWQPEPGRWITVTASDRAIDAEREVLLAASAVRIDPLGEPLTTPVHTQFLPAQLALAGAARAVSPGPTGDLRSTAWFSVGGIDLADSLIVYAEHNPADDGTGGPDATVAGYPARYAVGGDGQQDLTLYDVAGYRVNLHVAPSLAGLVDRETLERIALGLTIPVEAAELAGWIPLTR